MGAVERMVRETPPEGLVAALAASTDTGTLARATADQAASEALRRLDPLAGAIARGAEVKTRLAEQAGGLLPVEVVGRMLGITRAAFDKRRAAGKLLAVRVRSDWHYPACQFHDGEVLPGIPEILAGLSEATGWSVLSFLLAGDDVLDGRTPLAALKDGHLDVIRRLLAAREADAYQ